MFKKFLLTVVLAALTSVLGGQEAIADVYVRGYTRSNGTYVAPHYRSNPDRSVQNNWSTYPNVNPYTGKMGTRHTPSYSPSTPIYSPRPSFPSYSVPSFALPSFGNGSYGLRK